ncbi:hypothetical protein BGW38_003630 [Lunasporangiospora selenospora]|uniref:D-arabinono-1,4-lactone oxidase n=1 Tax=Lunasporangiospora selenospora TaxID=979761 RepID=A0A9P6G151_9FUNG|nr:hypothetical protein BGW38_003630 [Lunasporangiospora selenospora]
MDLQAPLDVEGSFIVVPSESQADTGSSTATIASVSDHQDPVLQKSLLAADIPTSTKTLEPARLQEQLANISSTTRSFQNWARTFRCSPAQYFTPSSEEEIVKIIHLARLSQKPVKAIGTGHSPSDLACTDGFMINTDSLNQLLNVDQKQMTITVAAGMKLHQIHQHLAENGLAMSNLGSISDQSIAGLISTATHGTGAEFSSLCASVLDLTLVTASGSKIYCSKTENKDIFEAAVCSLGALGIITRLTLQCEKAFRLENTQEPAKLEDVLRNLDSIIHSAEHDIALPPKSWRTSHWFNFHFYQGLLYICRFVPNLIPPLSRFMFWATQSKPMHRVDDSVRVFNFDCLFSQYVNEWAIPWSQTADALRALDQFIETGAVDTAEAKEISHVTNGLKVHFPVEIRFVKKDDVWLSPAYGVDSCYIGIIMYSRLEQLYPRLDEFSRIRQELDPDVGTIFRAIGRKLIGTLPKGQSLSGAIMVAIMRIVLDGETLSVNQARQILEYTVDLTAHSAGLYTEESKNKWAAKVQTKDWEGYWVPFQDQLNSKEPKEPLTLGLSDVGKASDFVILYIHGGGMVSGNARMYLRSFKTWMKTIQEKYNFKLGILTVEYGLSPEHPYPTALNQCVAAYRFLVEQQGIDPKQIIIAGDSAGGNLATTVSLKIRDAFPELPLPSGLALISPWVICPQRDPDSPFDYICHTGTQSFLPSYTNNQAHLLTDPYVSPVLAPTLKGLPKMLVYIGGVETLRPSIDRFVAKARKDGVEVQEVMKEGQAHIYFLVDEICSQENVNEAVDILTEFVAKARKQYIGATI